MSVARDDIRWSIWRDRITDVRVRPVADQLSDTTTCYAIFGRHSRETPQRERFQLRDNVQAVVLTNTGQNRPQRLKQAGVRDDVMLFAFHGRRVVVGQLVTEKRRSERWTSPTDAMRLRAQNDAAALAAA